MLKTKYYVAVLTSTLGASTQFYSNNVVNPSQAIVTTWINRAYLERTGNSLSPTQLYVLWSFVVACIPLGAIFGALSTNLITKKVGRRNGLFANGVLNVLGACLVYFAKPVNAPELLIVGRLILGANVGLGSGIVPMYLMEITPLKYRGAAGTAHEIAIAFSDSFSMLMALPEILGDEQYWPLAYAFPGVPALFLCLLILSCPESPKYTLITRGKREKAMSDLEKLVDSEQAKSMIDALDQEAHNLSENRPTFADLFAKELRLPLFITVWMMIAQQFTGIAAVFAYSTDMFSSAGLSPPIARYSTLALGIVYFVSTCSAAYLIERLGRRRLSIFQLSSITVVLGLVSVFAWLQQTNQAFWLAYTMIALFVVYMSVYGIGSPNSMDDHGRNISN